MKRVYCLYRVSTKKQVDKLMNYLRFWQASGESEKTSIRIRNKMQQMMLEGLYTGGPIRFRYHLVDSDLVNRKGAKIRKYEIDPMESELLRMIDDMTVHKGYGSYRMADFLNKNGYRPNSGGKFTSIKVNRSLRDPFYCGRLEDGTTSPQLEALRLRSDDTYDQILYILEQRQIIRKLFGGMDGAPEEEKLQAALKRQMAGNRAVQKKLDRELIKDRERLTKLQLEIGKTLTGESSYSADDLSQAIHTIKARIGETEKKLEGLRAEEAQERQGIEQITPAYERFRSWAEEFDKATLEQ